MLERQKEDPLCQSKELVSNDLIEGDIVKGIIAIANLLELKWG